MEIEDHVRLSCYVDESWLYKLKFKLDKHTTI